MRKVHEVSVKGLCEDETGKILVIKDRNNRWELPGGGLEEGEDLADCLKRECLEELGVECEVLTQDPYKAWVGGKSSGDYRLIILYRIKLLSQNYKYSEEAKEIKFVTKEEFKKINFVPQIKKIKQII